MTVTFEYEKLRGVGEEDRRGAAYICPRCGAGDGQVTTPARDGAYCRCPRCGHQWHDPRKPAPRATPPALRRKDDKPSE